MEPVSIKKSVPYGKTNDERENVFSRGYR